MKPPLSPLRSERRLTLELFDHYVAIARAERAEAIAQLGMWIVRRARVLAARLARLAGGAEKLTTAS